MLVTLSGIVTSVRLLHPLNAQKSIVFTLLPSEIFAIAEFLNAEDPTLVTGRPS